MIEYFEYFETVIDITLRKQYDLFRSRIKAHLVSLCNGHPELSAAAEHALDAGHRLKGKEPIVVARNFHGRFLQSNVNTTVRQHASACGTTVVDPLVGASYVTATYVSSGQPSARSLALLLSISASLA